MDSKNKTKRALAVAFTAIAAGALVTTVASGEPFFKDWKFSNEKTTVSDMSKPATPAPFFKDWRFSSKTPAAKTPSDNGGFFKKWEF